MKLEKLFLNEEITEIIFNDFNEIWTERNAKLEKSDIQFATAHEYFVFVKEVCRVLNVDIGLSKPFVNGRWSFQNHDFRVHIVAEHIASNICRMTFRRIRNKAWRLSDFLENDTITRNECNLLRKIVRDHCNLLVIGATGSGKTSMLNALSMEAPPNERLLILEDTDELYSPNSSSLKLLTYQAEEEVIKTIMLQDLVTQSLRMRPDRLIVGEIRGGEAKDLLLALSTGHAGSMGTLHATNAKEAILRLEMLIQLGAPQWSLETVRRLIFFSLHYIISVGKVNGQRKILSIDRLHSLEPFGIILEKAHEMTLPNSNKWEGNGALASPF